MEKIGPNGVSQWFYGRNRLSASQPKVQYDRVNRQIASIKYKWQGEEQAVSQR